MLFCSANPRLGVLIVYGVALLYVGLCCRNAGRVSKLRERTFEVIAILYWETAFGAFSCVCGCRALLPKSGKGCQKARKGVWSDCILFWESTFGAFSCACGDPSTSRAYNYCSVIQRNRNRRQWFTETRKDICSCPVLVAATVPRNLELLWLQL